MDYIWWNIILFLVATIIYYWLPFPAATADNNSKSYSYSFLIGYILLLLLSQISINLVALNDTCGTSAQNWGPAIMYTSGPWILIFCVLVGVLIMFPGFKSAFSDVIGYMVVSKRAKDLLDKILISTPTASDDTAPSTAETTGNKKPANDDTTRAVSDMLVKIYGDNSLLINQIVPSNFEKYWTTIQPLLKPEYRGYKQDLVEKTQFYNLVCIRDKIGECMWYIYTGILAISTVSLNMATGGCVYSPATMAERNKQLLEANDAAIQKQKLTPKTTYTVSA